MNTKDDDDTILIKVAMNTMSEDILVFIPPDLWDAENLAEGIKKAILMTLGNLPDKLDS